MVKTKKELQVVSNANSKGVLIDYRTIPDAQKKFLGRSPDFDLKLTLELIREDPVVRGSLITLVDKVLGSDWGVRGVDKKSRKDELETKLKQLRFKKYARKKLFNAILYNNAFTEIVKKGTEVTDLNVLETTLMKIDARDNGDILGYYQDIGSKDNNPYWQPEKVSHLELDGITNSVWSDLNIKALYDTILLKDTVRQWLAWFFKSNQMKGIFMIENASEGKIKEFVSYLKKSEKDPNNPVLLSGKVNYQLLNDFAKNGSSVLELLKWCDEQIVVLMQTTKISLGLPDGSGRSNGVEQNHVINVRVKAIQECFAEFVTYDLFPKMGFEKAEFYFEVTDFLLETQVLANVQVMRNSMFSDEAITEYLEANGIVFETDQVFKDPVAEAQAMAQVQMGVDNNKMGMKSNSDVKTGNEGSVGNKSKDSMPSRMRQTNSTISNGNKSTVVKNAIDTQFKGYPYEYNVNK